MLAADTIAAIATAPGEAAIGVIRVSGPAALAIAARLFHPAAPRSLEALPSHTVHLGQIRDPETGQPVDQVLLTLFRAPRSYTGEDVVEISAHGGPVPLRRILALCLAQGARLAEPGEFTCRAFLHGKLDLAQAEAVMDVVSARTERGLDVALGQLEGRLSALVRAARDAVLPLVAHLEATLDFPEEVPEMPRAAVAERIADARASVERLLAGAQAGRLYREGARVVIVGRPNVGKSSLLNALLREERAIVTAIPGTTRDVIEEGANIHGVPLRAIDTAGIRQTDDPIEAIGVQRTLDQLAAADLVLAVFDASQALEEDDRRLLERVRGRRVLLVANKCDLPRRADLTLLTESLPGVPLVCVSAREGTGLPALEEQVAEMLLGGWRGQEAPLVASARHQAALTAARAALQQAAATLDAGLPLELATTDLRAALDALGQVTGESVSDALLADIFGRFCIGK
ncbi:MAG: tRNA uridine-5-carboxymethylaminomethyl(34) synthesis GTPase MnmE [Armatimonadetes bacterium]|nr:tRNA uridine-5-carboxymethylaminomethyl(34) synthesis GTPase MnmE [Armatimonadota bacterium]